MGKRKRATKPVAKKRAPKLEKVFNCPFCGHEESVECTIAKSDNVGRLECRLCGVRYSTTIGRLEEEIDVYYKWIDACDAANRAAGVAGAVDEHELDEARGGTTKRLRRVAGGEGEREGEGEQQGELDEEEQEQEQVVVGSGRSGGRKKRMEMVVDEDEVDDEGL